MTVITLILALASQATERHTPVVEAVQRAAPYVVSIQTETLDQNPFAMWRGSVVNSSAGSGVILGEEGIILTNAHVVEGARSIQVHAADGVTWEADLLGLESDLDLAVLRVEATGLATVPLGSSADLMLGETVIAIGNPYGLDQTVTLGVVSQTSRELELRAGVNQTYIQTDAAINPGNSGGALINLDGELVGINTAIHAQAEGIGFAIPIDRALKVADDLTLFGAVDAPWLGVDVADVSQRTLRGLPVERGAVMVARVHTDSPAAKAGLRAYDLITAVNGRPVLSRADLNAHLAELRPGAKVKLAFSRDGHPGGASLSTVRVPEDIGEASLSEVLGIEVGLMKDQLVAVAVHPDGAWAKKGLRPGDRIVAVNGIRVSTPEQLLEVLCKAKAAHRTTASFTVARGRSWGTMALSI